MPYIEQEAVRFKKYTTAGTGTAYTVTVPNFVLYDGMPLTIQPNTDNTGALTINVNSTGAIDVKNPDWTALSAWQLQQDGMYELRYSSTQTAYILQTTQYTASSGTAVNTCYTTSNQALTASLADITDLTFPILANETYAFEFVMILNSNGTSTWLNVTCNGPAAPTDVIFNTLHWSAGSSLATFTAYDSNPWSSASDGTSKRIYKVSGRVINWANAGNLVARASRESWGTGTCYAGSYGTLIKLS